MTVGRFSVYKCHFREDVAQHSYFVGVYSMILADLELSNGVNVNVERLLRMALLHDVEEARTGDVHHPFKHQDEKFAEALNLKAMEWYRNLMMGIPESQARMYVDLREASEGGTVEATIVKAADKIEALLWAYEEYLLGNELVRQAKVVEDILSKLDRIELLSVKAILSEIRQNIEAMNAPHK